MVVAKKSAKAAAPPARDDRIDWRSLYLGESLKIDQLTITCNC
jgi:hypothetical protein